MTWKRDSDWEGLVETLAAIEHERWSHWQRYLQSNCLENDDGSLTIPAHLVSQWNRQLSTKYADLSESEKESDREQVRAAIPAISAFVRSLDPTPIPR